MSSGEAVLGGRIQRRQNVYFEFKNVNFKLKYYNIEVR